MAASVPVTRQRDYSVEYAPSLNRAQEIVSLEYADGLFLPRDEGDQNFSVRLRKDMDLVKYDYSRLEVPLELYDSASARWLLNPLVLLDPTLGRLLANINPDAPIATSPSYLEVSDGARVADFTLRFMCREVCARHYVTRVEKGARTPVLEPVAVITIVQRAFFDEVFSRIGSRASLSVPLFNASSLRKFTPLAGDVEPNPGVTLYRWVFYPARSSGAKADVALAKLNEAVKSLWASVSDPAVGGAWDQLLRSDESKLLLHGPQAFNVTAFLVGAFISDGGDKFEWPDVTKSNAPVYASWTEVQAAIKSGYNRSVKRDGIQSRDELINALANDLMIIGVINTYGNLAGSTPLVQFITQGEDRRFISPLVASSGTYVCSVISDPDHNLRVVLRDAIGSPLGFKWRQLGVFRVHAISEDLYPEEKLARSALFAGPSPARVFIIGPVKQGKPLELRLAPSVLDMVAASSRNATIKWHIDALPHYGPNAVLIPVQPTLTPKYLSEILELLTRYSRISHSTPFGAPIVALAATESAHDSRAHVLNGVDLKAIEEQLIAALKGEAIWPDATPSLKAFTLIIAAYLEEPDMLGIDGAKSAVVTIPNGVGITETAVLCSGLRWSSELISDEASHYRSRASNPLGWLSPYPRPLLALYVLSIGEPSPTYAPFESSAPSFAENIERIRLGGDVPVKVDPRIATLRRAITASPQTFALMVRRLVENRIQAACYVRDQLGGNPALAARDFSSTVDLFATLSLVPEVAYNTNNQHLDASWYRQGLPSVSISPYSRGEGFGIFRAGYSNGIEPRAVAWLASCYDMFGDDPAAFASNLSTTTDGELIDQYLKDTTDFYALSALVEMHTIQSWLSLHSQAASDLRTALIESPNFIGALRAASLDKKKASLGQVIDALGAPAKIEGETGAAFRQRTHLASVLANRTSRLEDILSRNGVSLRVVDATLPQLERSVATLLRAEHAVYDSTDREFVENFFVAPPPSRSPILAMSAEEVVDVVAPVSRPPAPVPAPVQVAPAPAPVVIVKQPPTVPAPAVAKPAPAPAPAPTPTPTPKVSPAPAAVPKLVDPAQEKRLVREKLTRIAQAIRSSKSFADFGAANNRYLNALASSRRALTTLRDHLRNAVGQKALVSFVPTLDAFEKSISATQGLFNTALTAVLDTDTPITNGPATGESVPALTHALYTALLRLSPTLDEAQLQRAIDVTVAAIESEAATYRSVPTVAVDHRADWKPMATTTLVAPDFLTPIPNDLRDQTNAAFDTYSRGSRTEVIRQIEKAMTLIAGMSGTRLSSRLEGIDQVAKNAPSGQELVARYASLSARFVQRRKELETALSDVDAAIARASQILAQDMVAAAGGELGIRKFLQLLTIGQLDAANRASLKPSPALAAAIASIGSLNDELDKLEQDASLLVSAPPPPKPVSPQKPSPKSSPQPKQSTPPMSQTQSIADILESNIREMERIGVPRATLNTIDLVNLAKGYYDAATTAAQEAAKLDAARTYVTRAWLSDEVVNAAAREYVLREVTRQWSDDYDQRATGTLPTIASAWLEEGAAPLLARVQGVSVEQVSAVIQAVCSMPLWASGINAGNIERMWSERTSRAIILARIVVPIVTDLLKFLSTARFTAVVAAVRSAIQNRFNVSGALPTGQDMRTLLSSQAMRATALASADQSIRSRWAISMAQLAECGKAAEYGQLVFWNDVRVKRKDSSRFVTREGTIKPLTAVAFENLLQMGCNGSQKLYEALNDIAKQQPQNLSFGSATPMVRERVSLWPFLAPELFPESSPIGRFPLVGAFAAMVSVGLVPGIRPSVPTAAALNSSSGDGAALRLAAIVSKHIIEAYFDALTSEDSVKALRTVLDDAKGEAQQASVRPLAMEVIEFINTELRNHLDELGAAIQASRKPKNVHKEDVNRRAIAARFDARLTNNIAIFFVMFHKRFYNEIRWRLGEDRASSAAKQAHIATEEIRPSLVEDVRVLTNMQVLSPAALARTALAELLISVLDAYQKRVNGDNVSDEFFVEVLRLLDVVPRNLRVQPEPIESLRFYFGGAADLCDAGLGSPVRLLVQEQGKKSWLAVRVERNRQRVASLAPGATAPAVDVVYRADESRSGPLSLSIERQQLEMQFDEDDEDGKFRRTVTRAMQLDQLSQVIVPQSLGLALAQVLDGLLAEAAALVARSSQAPAGSPLRAPPSPTPKEPETRAVLMEEARKALRLYEAAIASELGALRTSYASSQTLDSAQAAEMDTEISAVRSSLDRVCEDTDAKLKSGELSPEQVIKLVEGLQSQLGSVREAVATRIVERFRALSVAQQARDSARLEALKRRRREQSAALASEI